MPVLASPLFFYILRNRTHRLRQAKQPFIQTAALVNMGSKPPFATHRANGSLGPSLPVTVHPCCENAATDLMAAVSPECWMLQSAPMAQRGSKLPFKTTLQLKINHWRRFEISTFYIWSRSACHVSMSRICVRSSTSDSSMTRAASRLQTAMTET